MIFRNFAHTHTRLELMHCPRFTHGVCHTYLNDHFMHLLSAENRMGQTSFTILVYAGGWHIIRPNPFLLPCEIKGTSTRHVLHPWQCYRFFWPSLPKMPNNHVLLKTLTPMLKYRLMVR